MDSSNSCSLSNSIVDIHTSIVCVEDKADSRRVLEEFLSDVSRLGRRISRSRNNYGSEQAGPDGHQTAARVDA